MELHIYNKLHELYPLVGKYIFRVNPILHWNMF